MSLLAIIAVAVCCGLLLTVAIAVGWTLAQNSEARKRGRY